MMNDMYMMSSKPPTFVIDEKYFNGDWSIGIDLGKEDDMCSNNGVDYEKEEMREQLGRLKENHLGATTERFIDLAQNAGRSEHLGNKVRELEEKLYESNRALMRANEEVVYAKDQLATTEKDRQGWREAAIDYRRKYDNLVAKNRASKKKAPVKKTSKK